MRVTLFGRIRERINKVDGWFKGLSDVLKAAVITVVLGGIITGCFTLVAAYIGRPPAVTPLTPTVTSTSSATATATPMAGFAPLTTGTRTILVPEPLSGTQTPVERWNGYAVLYPACNCEPTVTQNDYILIRLRWGATTQLLAEQDAGFITYTALLDGKPISGINESRQLATYVAAPKFPRDPKDAWWVYWDYHLGQLESGLHKLSIQCDISRDINNGWSITSAGTEIGFELTINVITAFQP